MLSKHKRIESRRIRESAKGQDCTIRFNGICNFNPETTILAHFNGAGMGLKCDDDEAAYACSDCHRELDRVTQNFGIEYVNASFNEGARETRRHLKHIGLITIK